MSAPATPEAEYPTRDPQFMYELARDRLATQFETVGALDEKIGVLVSLASALLGIAAAVYALRAATKTGLVPALSDWQIATLAVGGGTYLVIAAVGFWAYFVKEWSGPPDLDVIWRKQKSDLPDDRLKWDVANDFMYSYEDNRAACHAKTLALQIVFVGAVVECLVLVTSLSLVAAGV